MSAQPKMEIAQTFTIGKSAGGAKSNPAIVTPLTLTWQEFVALLSDVQFGEKDGQYLTRCSFKGNIRSNENAEQIEFIVIDGDKKLVIDEDGVVSEVSWVYPPEMVHEALKEIGITHCIVPSFSNLTQGEGKHKWRIWIPAKLLNVTQLKVAVRWVLHKLEQHNLLIVNAGENSVVSQPWYLPRTASEIARKSFKLYDYEGEGDFPLSEAEDWFKSHPELGAEINIPKDINAIPLCDRNDAIGVFLSTHNSANDLLKLMQAQGFKFSHQGGPVDGYPSYYLTDPASESGIPGVRVFFSKAKGCWVAYSHHHHGVLANEHSHDLLSLYAHLKYSSDMKWAIAALGITGGSDEAKPSEEEAAGELWDEPADLWGAVVAPPLKKGILPEVIEAMAFELAEVNGFDFGGVAMASLCVCASMIDDAIKINAEPNDPMWVEAARLWVVLYGPPSAKKTPVLQRVTAPMLDVASELDRENDAKRAFYEAELDEWKATPKAKRGEKPTPPRLSRVMASDTSNEKLAELLVDNPRGLMLRTNEAGSFIGGSGAYSSTSAGAVKSLNEKLELYDGGRVDIDRISRGSLRVPNWSACFLGGSQPDALAAIFAKMPNNGFVQRVCWIAVKPVERVDRPIKAETFDRYSKLVAGLYAQKPGIERPKFDGSTAYGNEPVAYNGGANAVRKSVIKEMAHLMSIYGEANPRLADHIGKLEGLYSRIVLTLHCIDVFERQHTKSNPCLYEVSVETAEKAKYLLLNYILPQANSFHSSVLEKQNNEVSKNLLKLASRILGKGWKEITPGLLTNAITFWRYQDERSQRAMMKNLEHLGWIREVRVEKDPANPRKRLPAQKWIVNPSLSILFSDRAKKEADALAHAHKMMSGGDS
jgi:hypothetical protein